MRAFRCKQPSDAFRENDDVHEQQNKHLNQRVRVLEQQLITLEEQHREQRLHTVSVASSSCATSREGSYRGNLFRGVSAISKMNLKVDGHGQNMRYSCRFTSDSSDPLGLYCFN